MLGEAASKSYKNEVENITAERDSLVATSATYDQVDQEQSRKYRHLIKRQEQNEGLFRDVERRLNDLKELTAGGSGPSTLGNTRRTSAGHSMAIGRAVAAQDASIQLKDGSRDALDVDQIQQQGDSFLLDENYNASDKAIKTMPDQNLQSHSYGSERFEYACAIMESVMGELALHEAIALGKRGLKVFENEGEKITAENNSLIAAAATSATVCHLIQKQKLNERLSRDVEQRLNHLKGLNFAVMGELAIEKGLSLDDMTLQIFKDEEEKNTAEINSLDAAPDAEPYLESQLHPTRKT